MFSQHFLFFHSSTCVSITQYNMVHVFYFLIIELVLHFTVTSETCNVHIKIVLGFMLICEVSLKRWKFLNIYWMHLKYFRCKISSKYMHKTKVKFILLMSSIPCGFIRFLQYPVSEHIKSNDYFLEKCQILNYTYKVNWGSSFPYQRTRICRVEKRSIFFIPES